MSIGTRRVAPLLTAAPPAYITTTTATTTIATRHNTISSKQMLDPNTDSDAHYRSKRQYGVSAAGTRKPHTIPQTVPA